MEDGLTQNTKADEFTKARFSYIWNCLAGFHGIQTFNGGWTRGSLADAKEKEGKRRVFESLLRGFSPTALIQGFAAGAFHSVNGGSSGKRKDIFIETLNSGRHNRHLLITYLPNYLLHMCVRGICCTYMCTCLEYSS